MNLQAYANHRKALGLRGTSHVAVLNAINDGRLGAPAVQRQGRSWEINPELADQQWADATHPADRGTGHHRGQEPAAAEPEPDAQRQQPASKPAKRQSDATMPKGVPPRAVSEAMIAAIKAKREAIALQLEEEKLVYKEDYRVACNAVALQVVNRAEALPRQIKQAIPHLLIEEVEKIEKLVKEMLEGVAGWRYDELAQ
jgi:hypothetical protein